LFLPIETKVNVCACNEQFETLKIFRYLLILTAWLKLNFHIMQLRLQLRQALLRYLLQGTCIP